jgi:hypothetical protein
MRYGTYWLMACASLTLAGWATGLATRPLPGVASNTCSTTRPPEAPLQAPAPDAVPPEFAGQFLYGTTDLWTVLRSDGTWSGLPIDSKGYTQKVFWWSAHYGAGEGPSPALTVTGKRLGAETGPLIASAATNASADLGPAMLVGVVLPAPGCWQITGHYQGHDLSFVVRVVP